MQRFFVMLAAISFLALPGCGGDSGPTGPASFDVTGQWSGSIETGGLVEIQLNEDQNGNISGGGTISIGNESISIGVSGTHVNASVTLQISSAGIQDATYDATLTSQSRMDGELRGSGFSGERLILSRE